MSSKRTKIVKELDPQEVEGFSQARIEHYLRLGYKPYLDVHNEVKWLSEVQRSMRDARSRRPSLASRLASRSAYKKHRRIIHRGGLIGFIRAFWPFLLLMIVLAAALGILLLFPHIII